MVTREQGSRQGHLDQRQSIVAASATASRVPPQRARHDREGLMNLVLMTQSFDMLKEIGASSRNTDLSRFR